jgi:hypothetical protein
MVLAVVCGLEDAAAHHGPAGLVVVDVGGVDDGDLEIPGLRAFRLRPHGDPAAPPPTITTSKLASPVSVGVLPPLAMRRTTPFMS